MYYCVDVEEKNVYIYKKIKNKITVWTLIETAFASVILCI